MANFPKITFKLWTYWIDDPIDRGYEPMKGYILLEFPDGKLKLCERELQDG